MRSVHISTGIELCGFTHDKRHVFHRVLGQVFHINAVKVACQVMTRHDFLVKGFDDFGNGGYAAVLVKQGLELRGLGRRRRGRSRRCLQGAGFFAKSRA